MVSANGDHPLFDGSVIASNQGATPASGNAAARPEVVNALRISAARIQSRVNYESLLRQMVFTPRSHELDPKTALHHQKLLESSDGQSLLEIIWTASLNDAELSCIKAPRIFINGDVTAYKLAKKLADSKDDLAKTNTQIRSIAMAAADYHLIKREPLKSSLVILKATLLLHEFMIELGINDGNAYTYYLQTSSAALQKVRVR